MTVYLEYAFLENFFLDGTLLYLALKASRLPIKWRKIAVSATVGGVFAVIFPLLFLPELVALFLKTCVAFLLCFLAVPSSKKRKFLQTVACFFAFSFAFGGALTALNASGAYLLLGFCVLFFLGARFVKAVYQKRAVENFVYDCEIVYKQKRLRLFGFYDSGNFASYKGNGVHFLSPEIAFELFEGEWLDTRGEEIAVTTLAGEKKMRIFQGDLQIKDGQKTIRLKGAYFALSANMLSRGYPLLLHSRALEEKGETTKKKR